MSEQIWGQGQDKLAFSSHKPNIQYLYDELHRSLFYGGNMSRLTTSDDQRMCRWEGQSDDGKKHEEHLGFEPFPFEGSSDVRTRLIDTTINQLVTLLITSWQKANIKVNGIEVDDAEQAAASQTLMEWIVKNKIRADLEREAELWAQYTLQFGWSAVHVGWERKMAKRNDTITIEDIQNAAAQGNGILTQALDALQKDPKNDFVVMIIQNSLGCSKEEARKICKDLHDKGTADYEQPYIHKNAPVVAALKPFDEIAFPPETVDLQDARVIFKRTFMTEIQLRSLGATEQWDEDFIEQACHTAGKAGYLQDSTLIPLINTVPNAVEKANNLIEIVYSYAKQIDKSGFTSIYYTVFCPLVSNDVYGKHEILDYAHGEYPFIEFRRERLRRSIVESRGIPELLYTDQEELKAQHDATRDRTALEVMPPIMYKRRLAAQQRIGPGQLLPVNGPDDYAYLPSPTGTPATAFALMDRVEMKVASMLGLYHEKILPVHTQMTQQHIVNNYFMAWSQVYRQIFSLCLQYLLPEEIQRITEIEIKATPEEIHKMYDFAIKFDVREHDTDFVLEKLKTINQFVLPMDSSGLIDRNKLIKLLVNAIAPETAAEILTDQATASQKQYKDVQNDLALMMLGLEAQYTQMDPAASVKMNALQEILQKNPKAQEQVKSDGVFQKLLDNYQKNLQMSISQEKNREIGRTGVSPVGDQFAEMAKQGEQPQPDQAVANQLLPQGAQQSQPQMPQQQ